VQPDDSTGQSPGTPRQRGNKTVTVQGGFGACFCHHGTNFIEFWRGRGTKLIEARKLSRHTGFKLRADARVRVQEPLQICLEGRSKAKTVTSLLNIPSVLYAGLI